MIGLQLYKDNNFRMIKTVCANSVTFPEINFFSKYKMCRNSVDMYDTDAICDMFACRNVPKEKAMDVRNICHQLNVVLDHLKNFCLGGCSYVKLFIANDYLSTTLWSE